MLESSDLLPGVELSVLCNEPTDTAMNSKLKVPVFTVNLLRNHAFQGREDVLQRMHDVLEESWREARDATGESNQGHGKVNTPTCCGLLGMGGIGKTQTALEYVYRNRDRYDAVFWASAEQPELLSSTFTSMAQNLELIKSSESKGGQNRGGAVKKAVQWLETTGDYISSFPCAP